FGLDRERVDTTLRVPDGLLPALADGDHKRRTSRAVARRQDDVTDGDSKENLLNPAQLERLLDAANSRDPARFRKGHPGGGVTMPALPKVSGVQGHPNGQPHGGPDEVAAGRKGRRVL